MSASDSGGVLGFSWNSLRKQAQGRNLGQVAKTGIGAFIFALFASVIAGVREVFNLMLLPFRELMNVGQVSADNLLVAPLNIVGDAARATSQAIADTFGFASLPVSVIMLGLTLLIVVTALSLTSTSNVLLGTLVDNPLFAWFFGSPEEEEEED